MSPECGSGRHSICPGYYKMTHPCRCPCHRPGTSQFADNPAQRAESVVGPTRWRKRPVVIDAWLVNSQDHDDLCDLVGWCGGRAVGWDNHLIAIDTLEGTMYADNGDWVIRGVKGEFYPCKPDIFAATYERHSDGSGCVT